MANNIVYYFAVAPLRVDNTMGVRGKNILGEGLDMFLKGR